MFERRWVGGPEGEYLLLAGNEQRVREHEREFHRFARYLFANPFWSRYPRWIGDLVGGGRIEVRWRDECWAWRTEDEKSACAIAPRIAEAIAAGRWVPQRMPHLVPAGTEVLDG